MSAVDTDWTGRPISHCPPSMRHGALDDAFALAMTLCQGWGPQCSGVGECMHDGECFARDHDAFAATLIDRLAEQEVSRPRVAASLKRAAMLLRQDAAAPPQEER